MAREIRLEDGGSAPNYFMGVCSICGADALADAVPDSDDTGSWLEPSGAVECDEGCKGADLVSDAEFEAIHEIPARRLDQIFQAEIAANRGMIAAINYVLGGAR